MRVFRNWLGIHQIETECRIRGDFLLDALNRQPKRVEFYALNTESRGLIIRWGIKQAAAWLEHWLLRPSYARPYDFAINLGFVQIHCSDIRQRCGEIRDYLIQWWETIHWERTQIRKFLLGWASLESSSSINFDFRYGDAHPALHDTGIMGGYIMDGLTGAIEYVLDDLGLEPYYRRAKADLHNLPG